jgi:hypothetical protein
MSLRNFFLSLNVISTVFVLSSCSDLPSKPTREKKSTHSSLISKTAWMNVLPGAMSDEFCASDSDLLQCYPMSKEDCHKSVEQITQNCTNNYSSEIPAHLGKAAAATWGGTIGNCTKDGILQMIASENLTPSSDECRQTVEDM